MNLEEALKIADAVVFAKTGKHLNDVQSAIVQGTWQGQTYDDIAKSHNRSPEYLKQDVGFKLWRLLTQALGKTVRKKNFRTVMELLSDEEKAIWMAPGGNKLDADLNADVVLSIDAIPPSNPSPSPCIRDLAEAPDVSMFYGREEELTQLDRWIVGEGCRMVALLGMGGVGKTSLAAKLARRVGDRFDCIVWRSLRQAPLLTELLDDLIDVFSGNESSNLAEELDAQISQFLEYFRASRCLLVLDNFESLLQRGTRVGSYRSGYENYGDFLRQLGETRHQSCSILTSREKPKEIVFLEGGMLPVRSQVVRGLPERDARELLKAKGFTQSTAVWNSIVDRYGGNPLALKIVTTHIRDVFSSNAAEFLAEIEPGGAVFGDLSDFLEQQIDRLTDLEREIADWLAVNFQPISIAQLKEDLVLPATAHEVLETVESLIRRSVLELHGGKFSQPPIVMDYLRSRFIERIVEEILSEKLSISISHAIVKAQAEDYIRNRQIREILHPIAQKILARCSSRIELEEKFARLLEKLRGELGNPPGYAGGNLMNLGHYFQFDLTRYDFSHLKIWQAYLQDASLQNTNFTGADLSKSVFAKPLGDSIVVALGGNGLLATGDEDGKILLWQVADGQLRLCCQGQTSRVRSIAFNPQGTRLASGGDDFTVYLWDADTGECLNTWWEHTDTVHCLEFSADGATLASGSDDSTVRLWNVNSGQCLRVFPSQSRGVRSIAWSADDRTLASAGEDPIVQLWDVAADRCRKTVDLSAFSGEIHRLWAVAFVGDLPEERCLAAASDDRSVQLWDLETGECVSTLIDRDSISAVAFSPDGQFFGFADDLTATVRRTNGDEVKTLSGFKSPVTSLALSNDPRAEMPWERQILATGSMERVVQVWDATEGQRLRLLKGHKHHIDSFALSGDAGTLAIGSDNHTIELWDAVSGGVRKTLSGHRDWVGALAFSPDGRLLVSGSDDGMVKMWDVEMGSCLKTWDNLSGRIQAVVFSPDGTIVASADDQATTLWSVETGQHLHTLVGHERRVGSVAFSADGRFLASGSYDRAVKLWDVETGHCLQTLSRHSDRINTLSFSADGSRLASGSYDGMVKLWDVATGECQKTQIVPNDGEVSYPLYALTFRANGQLLLCSSSDDSQGECLQLWDGVTGECLDVFCDLDSPIWSAQLSADGSTLVGGYGRSIGLWDTQTGTLRQTLRTDKPYHGMKIAGMTGVSAATIETLKLLGAIDF
ncbi:MAG: NB-ARC domain-containing protein [Geitlerinemataceae cyanobacterium]